MSAVSFLTFTEGVGGCKRNLCVNLVLVKRIAYHDSQPVIFFIYDSDENLRNEFDTQAQAKAAYEWICTHFTHAY